MNVTQPRIRFFVPAFGRLFSVGLALVLARLPVGAQPAWLDRVDDALSVRTRDGVFSADLSGTIDLEGYYVDQPPGGMLFPEDHLFFNPRLSLFLDTHLGPHLYGFAQFRADRGFDPGTRPDGDARLDEYLLRWTPYHDARLHVQAGKFATVFGQWVNRHDSWNNPFINAPLAYEQFTTITDQSVPVSPAAFLARKDKPDKKREWLPMIWGPSYAAGASVFGRAGQFDYALELKNASISSRPAVWDPWRLTWDHPTVSGRFGVRPDAAWTVGASFSYGTYLLPAAETALAFPATAGLGDFAQTSVGVDVSFAWHHWQLWTEAIASRFEMPNVHDAETIAWFLEAKYKFTEHLFGAVRWNQQLYDKIPDGLGGEAPWDNDAWRVDLAAGWRFNRHFQAKVQYGYGHQEAAFQQGEQLGAVQLTVRF